MTLAVIQARTGSTRFPNKALAELHGKPLIRHVVERVQQTDGIDGVVVAVPNNDDATLISMALMGLDVDVVSGSPLPESDVLARYALVAQMYGADTILRITGDCPLWNPTIAAAVLMLYYADPHNEYASNVTEGYQDGTDVEVFSAAALRWASRAATDPYDKEHVGPWFKRHVKCAYLPATVRGLRKTSIDMPDDLLFVRAQMIMTRCEAEARAMTIAERDMFDEWAERA